MVFNKNRFHGHLPDLAHAHFEGNVDENNCGGTSWKGTQGVLRVSIRLRNVKFEPCSRRSLSGFELRFI